MGESSHGEAVNEIQIALEIAALKAVTEMAREGKIPQVCRQFSKLIHVGHSFGSAMTYALSAMYPDISDGIVLTGFSQVPKYMAYFALAANFAPVRRIRSLSQKYGPGYIAPRSKIGVHTNFFAPDNFDPHLLESAFENGQPATVGELLTVGSVPSSTDFAGPVMIITGGKLSPILFGTGAWYGRHGETHWPWNLCSQHPFGLDRDVPFCGGNCMATMGDDASGPNLIEQSSSNFKKAAVFNATVVPDVGHGLNFGYPAHSAFGIIQAFLKENVGMPSEEEAAVKTRRLARRTSSRIRRC